MKIYKIEWNVLGLSGKKIKYFKDELEIDSFIERLIKAATDLEMPVGQLSIEKTVIIVN